MGRIVNFVIRVILVLAGLVFVASALLAALMVLALWSLRALWARLTGQPVQPWAFQFDRQAIWNRFYRGAGQGQRPSQAQQPNQAARRDDPDIIDVEPKEIKRFDE